MTRTSLCAECAAAGRDGCDACGVRPPNPATDIFAPPPAIFSDDRVYRYVLRRSLIDAPGVPWLGEAYRPLVICGLNPSVANETKNDPTITREMDFGRRWGCTGLVKVNAYGYVSTDPKAMFLRKKKEHFDIVGPENDIYIVEAVQECIARGGIFLVAWGANIEPFRQMRLAEIIGEHAQCLAINKDGTPKHPLYMKADTQPQPWRLAA